jgi:hypothetical protein
VRKPPPRFCLITEPAAGDVRYHIVDQHDRRIQDGRLSLRIVDSFRSRRVAIGVICLSNSPQRRIARALIRCVVSAMSHQSHDERDRRLDGSTMMVLSGVL